MGFYVGPIFPEQQFDTRTALDKSFPDSLQPGSYITIVLGTKSMNRKCRHHLQMFLNNDLRNSIYPQHNVFIPRRNAHLSVPQRAYASRTCQRSPGNVKNETELWMQMESSLTASVWKEFSANCGCRRQMKRHDVRLVSEHISQTFKFQIHQMSQSFCFPVKGVSRWSVKLRYLPTLT